MHLFDLVSKKSFVRKGILTSFLGRIIRFAIMLRFNKSQNQLKMYLASYSREKSIVKCRKLPKTQNPAFAGLHVSINSFGV
jgi:hypothetical protein